MVKLHDGTNEIRRIAVMALLRNCEKYLQDILFPQLASWEKIYSGENGIKFSYYFLENDSIDQTRALIDSFMQGRSGFFVKIDGLPPIKRAHDGVNFGRVERLTDLRNRLLTAAKENGLMENDWTVIMDTDIVFDERILSDLFELKPAAKNIGMLCPYALEMNDRKTLQKMLAPESFARLPPEGEWNSLGHYYDTFALVYNDGHNTWPSCRFKKCLYCKQAQSTMGLPLADETAEENGALLEVKSCFGGFGLIKTDSFQHKSLIWDAFNMFARQICTCEHIMFCEKLRTLTGRRICIATKVDLLCLISKH